jgi:hypothetical protein
VTETYICILVIKFYVLYNAGNFTLRVRGSSKSQSFIWNLWKITATKNNTIFMLEGFGKLNSHPVSAFI